MEYGKLYRVTKRIKIHTKPLAEVNVVNIGKFLKETPKQIVFSGFRAKKENIVLIEKL
jgi:hypothetical protein